MLLLKWNSLMNSTICGIHYTFSYFNLHLIDKKSNQESSLSDQWIETCSSGSFKKLFKST